MPVIKKDLRGGKCSGPGSQAKVEGVPKSQWKDLGGLRFGSDGFMQQYGNEILINTRPKKFRDPVLTNLKKNVRHHSFVYVPNF